MSTSVGATSHEVRDTADSYVLAEAGGEAVPAGYKRSEVGVIPEDWRTSTVGAELDRFVAGISVNSVDETFRTYAHEQAVLKTSAVFNGHFHPDESKKIAPRDIARAKVSPTAGSILISRMNTPDLVGECGYIDQDCPNLFLPDRLWMAKPRQDSAVSPKWLTYLLSSPSFKRRIKAAATGTSGSMKNLSKGAFRALEIPFPNGNEQRAIAAALSDVDALLAKLDQLIAKKRDLKQAAMQQLLRGRTRLPGYREKWQKRNLGELADFFKGKGLPKSSITSSGSSKCIHYGELFTKYGETINEIRSFTNGQAIWVLSRANDVLMPTSDVTPRGLATASCIRENGVIIGGDTLIIRARNAEFDGVFLSYSITREREQILQLVTGSTVYHLYASDMARFSIDFPPLEEQTAIATILSNMDIELAALETRRDKTRSLKQGMTQALLTGRIRLT